MARPMTVTGRYGKYRDWALNLAVEYDDSDEGRLTALVVLWRCCREVGPQEDFKAVARPLIVNALERERVA